MCTTDSTTKKVLPWLLAIAIFMQMLDTTILNTALPAIAYDLNESPLRMQSIIISYTLVLTLCSPLSGFFSDRFGTRYLFIWAIFLFTLGSLLCALASSLSYLIAARMIQGMGGALLTPVARLAIIKTYPKSELLNVLNFAIMPALLGPVLGPLLGGYLVEWLSWHWIFLINIPIGIICIYLGLQYMPNYNDHNTRLDLKGFLSFGSAIFFITLGLDFLSHEAYQVFALIIVVSGFLLLFLYRRYAWHNQHSLFPLTLFKIRTFRLGIYGNLLARLGINAVPFLLPLFLQLGLGFTPGQSGWMLVPIAFASILMKPVITPLIHQFGYRRVLIMNTLLISFIIISIGVMGPYLSIPLLLTLLFLLGMGNSIQFSAMNSLTLADLRPYLASSGNGLMMVNQQLGLSLAVAISAIFLNLFTTHDLHLFAGSTQAFQSTFIVVGSFTFLSTFVFVRLKKIDGDNLANR